MSGACANFGARWLAGQEANYLAALRTGSMTESAAFFMRFSARFSLMDLEGFFASLLRGDFDTDAVLAGNRPIPKKMGKVPLGPIVADDAGHRPGQGCTRRFDHHRRNPRWTCAEKRSNATAQPRCTVSRGTTRGPRPAGEDSCRGWRCSPRSCPDRWKHWPLGIF